MSSIAEVSEGQSVESAIESVRADGYAVLENILSSDEQALIREELSPWLQGEKMGRNNFEGYLSERVYALLAKAPSVARIVEHAGTLAIVDAFLQPGYLLSAALAIKLHPGETEQAFHIDDGGNAALLRRPRDMVGVSTIWALDDFTEENGATEIVPGSHRWGEEQTLSAGDAIKVTMPAGSVVVFAGNVFHRGGANRSKAPRLALTVQYCMPWLRQIEQMVLAVPPEHARRYSPRVRAMLGYDVLNPGFMGYVDGMHPARLLEDNYVGRRARGVDTEVPALKPIY